MLFFLLTVENDLTFNDYVLCNQTWQQAKLKLARQAFPNVLWNLYGFKLQLYDTTGAIGNNGLKRENWWYLNVKLQFEMERSVIVDH